MSDELWRELREIELRKPHLDRRFGACANCRLPFELITEFVGVVWAVCFRCDTRAPLSAMVCDVSGVDDELCELTADDRRAIAEATRRAVAHLLSELEQVDAIEADKE